MYVGLTVPYKCVQFRDPRLNRSEERQPNSAVGGIFCRFSNFYKWRPKVAGDVMSGVALVYVGVDVCAKFGDSRLNSGRIIRLFAGQTRFTHFVQCLIAFCSQPETASDVISGTFVGLIVHDKLVKFCNPRLNRPRKILVEAVGFGIFDRFLTSMTANRK